jgi:outer membrane receptor protein involved in Fe transport
MRTRIVALPMPVLTFVALVLLHISGGSASLAFAGEDNPPAAPQGQEFTVFVFDSSSNVPLERVRVILRRDNQLVGEKVTNLAGIAEFLDIEPGAYEVTAHLIGYSDSFDSIDIGPSLSWASIGLKEISLQEVVVSEQRILNVTSIDLGTGNQVFESETYHAPPTSRMTDIIQESLSGAVKAPTGEVHIRGQHGEYTYYVDGLPVPLGVFGGLNEVVDPKVIDRAVFVTGGFPAEYGGQIAAIVDVQNRVPSGRFHLDFSTYAGSYLVFNGTKPFSPGADVSYGASSSAAGDTLGGRVGPFRAVNSNGQNLSISDHVGGVGYFVSASRQETDRRIDTPVPTLYNDKGKDYFLYGKFDYLMGERDYLTANLNYGKTNTEVPFSIDEQGFSPDEQQTSNSFQTLSYYHTISSGSDHESNLFVGAFARQGSLLYTPSPLSPVSFQFAGDTTMYALTEDRSFSTLGVSTKYDVRLSHRIMFKAGLIFSSTTGTEDFASRDDADNPGPHVTVNYSGSDFGIFGQTQWHPLEWTRFDAGVRYDQHIAPDAALQKQVSPRLRWNIFFDDANTAYLYYGRIFMPNNIEGIRLLASNVGTDGIPTLPEKDNFYEVSYSHSFNFGLKSKFSFFHKDANPGVDDETIGSSAVKTPVNIQKVKTTGLEAALSYANPATPFTGYLNISLIHAYGSGPISGGFLPPDDAGEATDLDHDQRLSMVGSVNYQPPNWFVNLTAIYGSGLTNGNPNDSPFETGLFAFNSDAHVDPYIVFNLAVGHTFSVGGTTTLEPSLYITNIFDSDYLLKGAYFSAASYGERRNVVFKLSLHV